MDNSIISRIHNNYVHIINEQVLLPKAVIVVLEDDVLQAANHYKKGISKVIMPWIDWLVSNLFTLADKYKTQLPTKSRKFKYPQFFWVPAILHDAFGMDNIYREKFNDCLSEAVEKTRGMRMLQLPTWNRHDYVLCSYEKLNQQGKNRLWTAINDAFQAWDKDQMKRTQFNYKANRSKQANDRFHWRRDSSDEPRRKLLKPPHRALRTQNYLGYDN